MLSLYGNSYYYHYHLSDTERASKITPNAAGFRVFSGYIFISFWKCFRLSFEFHSYVNIPGNLSVFLLTEQITPLLCFVSSLRRCGKRNSRGRSKCIHKRPNVKINAPVRNHKQKFPCFVVYSFGTV